MAQRPANPVPASLQGRQRDKDTTAVIYGGMGMDIQRLRNLTTGRLHTEIGDVYQDIETIVGESGIMTHMLPNAARALEPYLRKFAPDESLWLDVYDPAHIGEIDVPPMNDEERMEFWSRYSELPSPFQAIPEPERL